MVLPVPPPATVLIIGVGIFAVVATSALRREGSARVRLITISAAAVMIGGLLVFIYRPRSITIDAEGISSNSGRNLSVSWSQVTLSAYIPNLQSSEYRPTSKVKGVAVGPYRVGVFNTAGAGKVRVIAQQQESALVVKAGHSVYEFAPDKIASMAAAVAKHVALAGWPHKQ